jgi:succinyl-CoA synthetase alpha subunit
MGLCGAVSLEDAAHKAVALSKGETPHTFDGFDMGEEQAKQLAKQQAVKLEPTQRYLRGLYTGGTLCDETMKLLIANLGNIYSNIPLDAADMLEDKERSHKHTCLDFGDDAFTLGRPHPMIDPSLRNERIIYEAKDAQTAVILLDCVIGYGAHEDAAGELAKAIAEAKKNAAREVIVVASVCGTEEDPQNLTKSRDALKQVGVLVFPSNAQAARFTQLILDCLKD